MDWKERIKTYTAAKRKHQKAKERYDLAKSAWSEEQDALMVDLTEHKEAAGEDPTCVVNGRMIGKTYADQKGCTDPAKLVARLVEYEAAEFLKPQVAQVYDAVMAGQFSDEETAVLRRLLTTTRVPKLFDKKAPGAKK